MQLNKLPVADRSTSRIINRRTLLDIIIRSNGVSKADLAKELGLSKPTVSKNIADLIAMGLVEETGEGEASKNGGRKPIMLHFNSTFRYICALDLSLQNPVCAIGNLNHQILRLKKVTVDRDATAQEKREAVAQAFDELIQVLAIPKEKLGLMVISHPGIIGEGNKVVHVDSRHHSWTDIGLVNFLKEKYNAPIVLETNVRLAAIGEMQLGYDYPMMNFIYVDCGVGLGFSVIVKGQPYEGCNRVSDGLGSFLLPGGKRAEDVLAMEGLIQRVAQCYKPLTFKQIVELSLNKNPEITDILYEAGKELGGIIYNCSVLMDIPKVIFGGDYLKLGQAFFDGLQDGIPQNSSYPVKIFKSTLQESAGVLGGFVLGQEEMLKHVMEKTV